MEAVREWAAALAAGLDHLRARLVTWVHLVLAVSTAAVLAVVDLLGMNRGEVTRLWIFIMVFVQAVVAVFCLEKGSPRTVDVVLAGAIVQSAVTISMVAFVES